MIAIYEEDEPSYFYINFSWNTFIEAGNRFKEIQRNEGLQKPERWIKDTVIAKVLKLLYLYGNLSI